MKEFDFTLKFSLSNKDQDPEIYVESLYAAGCDDAIIGIGKRGRIALEFFREGFSAKDTMLSAIKDVLSVIPDATLIESSPDQVSLTEAAEVIGCSRQNLRQLMLSHQETFPSPSHEGAKLAIYHLDDILDWQKVQLAQNEISSSIREVAAANKEINIFKEIGVLSHPVIQNESFYSKLVSYSPLEIFTRCETSLV